MKHYSPRILELENGSFTPLVFSVNGGMGREAKIFYTRLAEMIAEKRDVQFSVATLFIRTKISFSLLKSTLLCIRGSRSLKKMNVDMKDLDIDLMNKMSNIEIE